MGPDYTRTPDGRYTVPGTPGENPNDPHGTAILSKVAGKQLGAVKNINAVIVRDPLAGASIEDVIESLTWIINDWVSLRNSQAVKVGIINMSFEVHDPDDNDGPHYKAHPDDIILYGHFEYLLNLAISEGLLPICSAGNDGQVSGLAVSQERVLI